MRPIEWIAEDGETRVWDYDTAVVNDLILKEICADADEEIEARG